MLMVSGHSLRDITITGIRRGRRFPVAVIIPSVVGKDETSSDVINNEYKRIWEDQMACPFCFYSLLYLLNPDYQENKMRR